MLGIDDVQARARVSFDRNWRNWAHETFIGPGPTARLSVNLRPPREGDLRTTEQIVRARAWVEQWRDCTLAGVEWKVRSWASVGDQSLPLRVVLESPEDIAAWAERQELWSTAVERMSSVRAHLQNNWREKLNMHGSQATRSTQEAKGAHTNAQPFRPTRTMLRENPTAQNPQTAQASHDAQASPAPQPTPPLLAAGAALRSSIGDWCDLEDADWDTALHVWDWLLAHAGETRYVRQLPIRGIDTKWIERHGKALRPLYRAIAGEDFSFAQPGKLFRCKACCPEVRLGGCDEFALTAAQLAVVTPDARPRTVVICENLMNTLCLHDLPGTLAIHGSGFAVTELGTVPWLVDTPVVYWGDLDTNGFAILNALRSFAPHARSVMMDARTLQRHFDLCVEEPKPATGSRERLTPAERDTVQLLAQGDPSRGIANLRLEQERVEWDWAYERVAQACSGAIE